ncbi:MAG: hypothetical protein ACE5KV_06175 [Thermoplasmata archaeon]
MKTFESSGGPFAVSYEIVIPSTECGDTVRSMRLSMTSARACVSEAVQDVVQNDTVVQVCV